MTVEKKEDTKKCKYTWGNYKCSKQAPPGDEHCIFHSEDIEGKKDKFNDAFWNEFKRQKKHEKKYDFTGFVFPGYISFKNLEFEKDAYFGDAQFSGNASFGGSKFFRKAYFWEAQFSGNAIFERALFSGEAGFTNARFSRVAFFRFARFSGEVNFSHAQFSGESVFLGARFSGEASFWKSRFSGEVDFLGARFSEEANFYNAKFKEEANFDNIKIEKYSSFEMIDTYFYNVSGLFEFIEANIMNFEKLRKIRKTLKTEFLPKTFKLILGEGVTARYPVIVRQIKDDIYLMDKRERNSKMKGIKRCWYKSLYFLWWLFADYGRSFKRWAAWSIGIAVVFGFLFFIIGPESFKAKPDGYTWFSFFYYSIVTFTTLGFGDITPITWVTEILVTIEVIMGYIMLGGLISILANKLARRS